MGYEEVREQFDLPRLKAFTAYTQEHPPLHVMVAAYFGIGGGGKPERASQDDALTELIAYLPAT